jgi:Lon-like protease
VAGFPAVDTLDPTVPDPPLDGPAGADDNRSDGGDSDRGDGAQGDPVGADELKPRPRHSRRWIALGVVVALLTASIVTAALVKVPYYLLSPGSVRRTEELITVQGADIYPQDGSIGYTTVSVQHATALEWAVAHLDDSISFEPQKAIQGTQTPEQYQQANLQMMTDSKETASAVALERLGYDVTVTGTGAVIVALADNSPSTGVLAPNDTVVSVDDTPITSGADLVKAIGAHHPGDTVTLGVQPYADDGSRTTEKRTVTLAARPDDAAKAYLGVSSLTRELHYDLPVQVTVDSGAVGGPSAGLDFTLGIMDVMTPGSITGGHKVATTGTIAADGTVGPVGGVHQKTLAVKESGAELFIVPRSEYDEAEKYAGSLRVEPVDNVDDALKVLATLGGGTDVLPTTTTTGH